MYIIYIYTVQKNTLSTVVYLFQHHHLLVGNRPSELAADSRSVMPAGMSQAGAAGPAFCDPFSRVVSGKSTQLKSRLIYSETTK